MKKLLFFLSCTIFITGLTAQVPDGFNYQAVARDGSGLPLVNKTIQVKISILSDTAGFHLTGTGTYIWEEQQSTKTNSVGLFTLVIGNPAATKIQGTAAAFGDINWKLSPLFIGIKVQPPAGTWKIMGSSRLWSVPYSMVSNGIAEGSKVTIVSEDDATTEALFEVKRKDGQPVFSVYPDAVNIYVPRSGKGVKGGFAVGGFDASKADPQDYFRVTPDSVRIYIDPNPAKGVKGGFAVGGYDESKGINDMYFNLTGATSVNTVAASPQVLWYPNKNAFLAGNVHIGHIDSVGNYSTALGYQSRAIGNYSQAFGYKATAFGNYSTSIGKKSVAGVYNLNHNAFALGNGALATGEDSYALGSGALATGRRSFAFGSVGLDDSGNPTSTPTQATADYASAFGMGAQAQAKGSMAFGVGSISSGTYSGSFGYYSIASGSYATALGYKSVAAGYASGVLGFTARAEGYGSLALGRNSYTTSTAQYSVAIGDSAKVQGYYAAALGNAAKAKANYSVAIGYQAVSTVTGIAAASFGYTATSKAPYSVAVGPFATTGLSANYSGSFGYYAQANSTYSVAVGFDARTAGEGAGAFGRSAYANGKNSVAVGFGALTSAEDAGAFGKSSTASGLASMAMGPSAIASGSNSVSIGFSSDATNTYSVAMGYDAQSTGQYAMAMGYNPTASNNYSTAIGYQALASGLYSTALGNSKAYGDKSTALGTYYSYTYLRRVFNKLTGTYIYIPTTINVANTATRGYSLAVGNGNNAEDGGIAIGSNNAALSSGAVALGHSNTADTTFSFAAGYRAKSAGINAMAIGENVTAQSANSLVVGSYNQTSDFYNKYDWVETDPLFVVGNGDENTGHDAFKITKNGTTYIQQENASYGLYNYGYNTTYTGTSYGVYTTNNMSNAANTGIVYGGYTRSLNYGTGATYGLRSYAYNYDASNASDVYSGFFSGGAAVGSTYKGLYADIRSGGSIDVAEYIYDTKANTQPADVVVADPANKESVIKSSKPYQTGVLGVISTKPHMTMGMELVIDEETGEQLKDAKPAARLALTGRVPVNVSGENGAIVPGDYLTSSSISGHAMKWTLLDVNSAKDFDDLKKILAENEKRRGAIFGKAVESFTGSGTGKIMVLISLQ